MRSFVTASAALLSAAACTATLPEAELQRLLQPAAPPGTQRLQLEVELSSPTLSGTFDGVLIARAEPPAVRLQLLPDLGAPILDVAAQPEAIAGVMHGDAQPRVWRGAAGDPELSLLLLFGITLLEQHAPVTRERVVAAAAGSPPRLRLRGCFPGTVVTDAVVAAGVTQERRYALGPVRWRDRLAADEGTVEGPGFRLRARVVAREDAGVVDEALFRLAGTDATR